MEDFDEEEVIQEWEKEHPDDDADDADAEDDADDAEEEDEGMADVATAT